MKAPDKIFISIERTYGASNGQVIGMAVPHSEKQSESDIEYIHKDALLEWAKEKNQRIDTDEGDYSLGYVSAMIDLIDKINSL